MRRRCDRHRWLLLSPLLALLQSPSFVSPFVSPRCHRSSSAARSTIAVAAVWIPQEVEPVVVDINNIDVDIGVQQPSSSSLLLSDPSFLILSSSSSSEPSPAQIKLLRTAFAALYQERNLAKAESLLTQTIQAWESQQQPPDEVAGLYRVRGDCYMLLSRANDAANDYTTAITLLQGPGGDAADETELPLTLLARARALRSLRYSATTEQRKQSISDYQTSIRLSARSDDDDEDYSSDADREADGAVRNPYAAWEWGMAVRNLGEDYNEAARIHRLAASAFDAIGDRPRSVLSELDAGIDLASSTSSNSEEAISALSKAIRRTTSDSVESRDVPLLQRVIAKEGQARIALASVYWSERRGSDAETEFTTACSRLDQLAVDAVKQKTTTKPSSSSSSSSQLRFTIDDEAVDALDVSCSRFKRTDFLDQLEWPASLQAKVGKLNSLGRP